MDKNIKRPVVWQDVRRVKPVPQKPVKKSRIFGIKTLFNKTTVLISKNKFAARISLASTKLSKRNRKIALLSSAVILIILSGFYIKTNVNNNLSPDQIKIEELAAKTPQFETLIPKDKTIEDLGGWRKLTPPNNKTIFVYLDTIDNVEIKISQQTLPEEFQEDKAAQIEQLAKGFKADEKITVGDTVAFVGTNISGAQSVIFEKNNILILITSAAKINSTSWATYIGTLK